MADQKEKPVATIVVGMAGAGKTTFMQRLTAHLYAKRQTPYIINLDPAVLSLPYPASIDIRDTINYKQVMKQYSLGPNGGILTSLNLFTTKFDQVLSLLEARTNQGKTKHVLLDTPGQIEIFTWSASGAIITDSLASSMPTVLTYIIDSPRSKSCSTFISSMLYAISILYKTKLPMIIVFNKIDLEPCDEAISWMRDWEVFQAALRNEEEGENGSGGSGYMNSLMNSMALVLEEFYAHLDVVGVSSMTGEGFDEYLAALDKKKEEYETTYKPELDALVAERKERNEGHKREQLNKLMQDVALDEEKKAKTMPKGKTKEDRAETVSDLEDNDDDEDDDDDKEGELVEPDSDEDFASVETREGQETKATKERPDELEKDRSARTTTNERR